MFTPLKKTVTALAVAALLGAAWTVTGVQGGFTAKVTNSKNSIGSGIVFVAAAGDGSTQCDTTPAGSTIPSTSAFDWSNTTRSLPPQTPGGSVVNTTASMDRTLSATGTISPGSATYRRNSCGVVQLANTIDATNPLLVRGTVQFARAANWSDAGSLLVDGTSALGSSVTTTAGSTSTSSTVGIWFKAAPGSAGGALIAMDPSAAQVTSSNSVTTRLLYLDATGNVVAGAHSGTITVSNRFKVTTTGTDYRDNSWHFAALTIAPSGNKTALKLYVDGSLKKSSTSTGAAESRTRPTAGAWAGPTSAGPAVSSGADELTRPLPRLAVPTPPWMTPHRTGGSRPGADSTAGGAGPQPFGSASYPRRWATRRRRRDRDLFRTLPSGTTNPVHHDQCHHQRHHEPRPTSPLPRPPTPAPRSGRRSHPRRSPPPARPSPSWRPPSARPRRSHPTGRGEHRLQASASPFGSTCYPAHRSRRDSQRLRVRLEL